MIDNKKEQERAELHRTIWGIANDLRGSVDGWDFKNYVLVMLFYRYISENLTNYINAGEAEAGTPDFDYTQLSDDEAEAAAILRAADSVIQDTDTNSKAIRAATADTENTLRESRATVTSATVNRQEREAERQRQAAEARRRAEEAERAKREAIERARETGRGRSI